MTSKLKKLLIGYDGSSDADAAIEDLVHAGMPHNVEALIASVWDASAIAAIGSLWRQCLGGTCRSRSMLRRDHSII